MINDPEFKEKATKALGPFPLIIGKKLVQLLKKLQYFQILLKSNECGVKKNSLPTEFNKTIKKEKC